MDQNLSREQKNEIILPKEFPFQIYSHEQKNKKQEKKMVINRTLSLHTFMNKDGKLQNLSSN